MSCESRYIRAANATGRIKKGSVLTSLYPEKNDSCLNSTLSLKQKKKAIKTAFEEKGKTAGLFPLFYTKAIISVQVLFYRLYTYLVFLLIWVELVLILAILEKPLLKLATTASPKLSNKSKHPNYPQKVFIILNNITGGF